MSDSVEFYFDYLSPYTYLAITQIPRLLEPAGIPLIYKPFVLSSVIEQSGNMPATACQNKFRYSMHLLPEIAADYGIPFTFPKIFPLVALRSLRIAKGLEGDSRQGDWVQANFRAYWGEGRDLRQDSELQAIAAALNLDWESLKSLSENEDLKQALKDQATAAVKRGVFGVPTWFYRGKMYFGNESLGRFKKVIQA